VVVRDADAGAMDGAGRVRETDERAADAMGGCGLCSNSKLMAAANEPGR
jgi:hypothetical protein